MADTLEATLGKVNAGLFPELDASLRELKAKGEPKSKIAAFLKRNTPAHSLSRAMVLMQLDLVYGS